MDENSFREQIQQSSLPVLVEIWAPWCRPCQKMAPAIDRLAEQYVGQVEVLKINADESQELVRSLKVYGIPTLIAYWGGEEQVRQTGSQPESSLAAFFKAVAAQSQPPSRSLMPIERVFRLIAGAILVVLGWQYHAWVLLAAGGVVMFSGVYDRCPIWKAFTSKLRILLRKERAPG